MVNYRRVNKPTARKMFNHGISIKLLPCKVNELALDEKQDTWVKPVEISLFTCEKEANKFDRTVNDFEYYNCNAELGYYAHYYVTEDDYNSYQMCNMICN